VPGSLPAFRGPQLATLTEVLPTGPDWLFEMKYDGYRCMAAVSGYEVRLFTRSGLDWTRKFRVLVEPFAQLTASTALIDGEICTLTPSGRTDFSGLARALETGAPLVFFAFDLLEADGADLTSLPLIKRKARLERLLGPTTDAAVIRFAQHVQGNGSEVFDAVCREGHEGVIAKEASAPYRSARTRSWLKIKCVQQKEFVVTGWTPSSRKDTFASLLLGTWEAGQLIYRGRVGTGFSVDGSARLQRELDARAQADCPVSGVPREIARAARWVVPTLVADIAFAERTPEGRLRHASFLGLRDDTSSREVSDDVEHLAALGIAAAARLGERLTSPERIAYPEHGISKASLAGYYDAVSERMLPFLVNRPLSLVRCPEGRAKHCFFQKHDSGGFPHAMGRVGIPKKSGTIEQYFFVRDLAGLLAGVQMNVLEWHVWGSRIDAIETPERLVFDLDPDDSVGFAEVCDSARMVADLLEDVGILSFPLLSGGKGLHVVAPIVPGADWPFIKQFCHDVADVLVARQPTRFVASMAKVKRHRKIFIDYLRNDRGATAIAPWSTRARAGAPVAVPVRWQDLDCYPGAASFSVEAAAELAQGSADPWPTYFSLQQYMPDARAALDSLLAG